MAIVLWQLDLSHYNEKARWALDFKSISHVRRSCTPGVHGLRALALTRGAHRRLPVLDLDGTRIGDSTAIIAALERHAPQPALYPEDPVERARALELEDHFDEVLAPAARTFVWFHLLRTPDLVPDWIMPSASARRRRVMRRLVPSIAPGVRWDFGVDRHGAERALATVRAEADRLEREIGPSGHLVGDRFSVADLAAAALFTPLLAPPERPFCPRELPPGVLELREELEAREAGRWVAETYARHRGTSAAVAPAALAPAAA